MGAHFQCYSVTMSRGVWFAPRSDSDSSESPVERTMLGTKTQCGMFVQHSLIIQTVNGSTLWDNIFIIRSFKELLFFFYISVRLIMF